MTSILAPSKTSIGLNLPATSQTPVSSIQESSPGVVTEVDDCVVVDAFVVSDELVVVLTVAVVVDIESVGDGPTTYPET